MVLLMLLLGRVINSHYEEKMKEEFQVIGKVKVWYMTEEQRLEYIKKHPIKPTERPNGTSYSDLISYSERTKIRHSENRKKRQA